MPSAAVVVVRAAADVVVEEAAFAGAWSEHPATRSAISAAVVAMAGARDIDASRWSGSEEASADEGVPTEQVNGVQRTGAREPVELGVSVHAGRA
jgi:hypothetical protein